MQRISATVLHSTFGVAVGGVSGAMVDAIFPEYDDSVNPTTQSGFISLAAEIVAQLAASSLLTVAFVDLTKQSPPGMQDPAAGFAYLIGVTESQPGLKKKIRAVTHGFRALFTKEYDTAKHWAETMKNDMAREFGDGPSMSGKTGGHSTDVRPPGKGRR